MTMLNQDELYHFGIKGMKWGSQTCEKASPES